MLALLASAGEEFPSDDDGCITNADGADDECITNVDEAQLQMVLHAEDGVGKND